jgi:hypothetical protein
MRAARRHALAHRAREVFLAEATDSRLAVRGDVRAVVDAEGRLEGAASGELRGLLAFAGIVRVAGQRRRSEDPPPRSPGSCGPIGSTARARSPDDMRRGIAAQPAAVPRRTPGHRPATRARSQSPRRAPGRERVARRFSSVLVGLFLRLAERIVTAAAALAEGAHREADRRRITAIRRRGEIRRRLLVVRGRRLELRPVAPDLGRRSSRPTSA